MKKDFCTGYTGVVNRNVTGKSLALCTPAFVHCVPKSDDGHESGKKSMTALVLGSFAAPPRMNSEEFVCWSRMQAEAGQQLEAIIFRKERERQAGGGMFCWGV